MNFVSESCEIKNSIRGRSLMQGPRPSPLKVSDSSTMIKKSSHNNNRNRTVGSNNNNEVINPVVIYLRSPKIIHVRPEEFMSLVQRLTGKDSSMSRDIDRDDESGVVLAEVIKRSSSSGNLFDEEMSKLAFNGVENSDQILELSPSLLRFLACV